MRSRAVRSPPRPGTRRSPTGAGFRKSAARCGRPGSDARGAVRIHVTMNHSPSARTAVRLITPFLVAACQPQARRLLLLDLALSDPVVLNSTARPWAVARPVGDEPLGSAYDPFPLDRNHVVVAREPTQLLALTSHRAFVRTSRAPAPRPDAGIAAAVRIGEGLVVVISRHALGTLGPQYRPSTTPFLAAGPLADTYAFLRAVARWTRRPAEWAHVPPATHRASLALQDAPLPVELQPPRLAPPDGVETIDLPLVADKQYARPANVPDWLRQQGLRVLWTPLLATREEQRVPRPHATLDSLVTFLDVGGFNLLSGDAYPEGADSMHARWWERDAVRRAWSDVVSRLGPTN